MPCPLDDCRRPGHRRNLGSTYRGEGKYGRGVGWDGERREGEGERREWDGKWYSHFCGENYASRRGAHLPSLGREPVGGNPISEAVLE